MKTRTKKMGSLKFTSWLVLGALFAQYGAAFAAPGLRESVRAGIESELAKKYEAETPGIGKSVGDRLLESSSKAIKTEVVDMLTDFKMGVINASRSAWEGNGTVVVIGAKDGWKLLKHYGEQAGIHYMDSVWLLPKKAQSVGRGFATAGRNAWELAKDDARHTASAWKEAAGHIRRDAAEWKDGVRVINETAGEAYKDAADGMIDGVRGGAHDAMAWARDVYQWTRESTTDAFGDLTYGTVENARATGRWTKRVGKTFVDETVESAKSVNRWSQATWDWTTDSTGQMWTATKSAGAGVFDQTTGAANETARWLKHNVVTPARQAKDGVVDYSKWNWRKGWTQGVKQGFKTAGNAWEHDDKLMATLWVMAGVGSGTLHVLLLEPTVLPFIATYGVAGTVALSTLGYPSVGAMYAAGTLASGVTYAGGALATGATAVGGTAATFVAGSGGIVRTVGTAGIGVAATGATAVGGAAYTTGAAGVNLVRTLGTPVVGGLGMAGAMLGGGAEIVGTTVYNGARMAGITALTAAGYTFLTGYEAAKMTYSAIQAVGITVFDNAIVTPGGLVVNLAQAVATGAWTLVEDPVLGSLSLMAAGGILVGTLVTSTGAFAYELVKGTLKGLGHGIVAVAQSGVWIVGAVAKGVEFVWTAFNIPKHREWAHFRREEISEVFDSVKKNAGSETAARFGDIILIRVHWWGESKGRVRFFISKNKMTGERWYFKRAVDPKSCEIYYSATNHDPLVRAFMQRPWSGAYRSGLFHKACEEAKQSK